MCTEFRSRAGGRAGTLSLELGHTSMGLVRVAGDRILTQDGGGGRWILWDSTTGNMILSGDAAAAPDLAGAILTVTVSPTAANVLSAYDGHPLASLTLPNGPLQVGPGGAYVWSAGSAALRAWTTAGALIVDVAGDYSQAKVAAAATELRVAGGPAGANIVERVAIGTSVRTTASFMGVFDAWFGDGERFITHVRDTFIANALDGTQLQFVTSPFVQWTGVGGVGDFFWIVNASQTRIFNVASSTALTPAIHADSTVDPSAHVFVNSLSAEVFVFSGSSVYEVVPDLAGNPAVAAASPEGHWVVGTHEGLVYDSRTSIPRTSLSCGFPQTVAAAASGDVAISAPTHQVVMARPGAMPPAYRVPIQAARVELTADGHELAVSSTLNPNATDSRLDLLALPAGTTLASWVAPTRTAYLNLHVSPDGGVVAHTEVTFDGDENVVQAVGPGGTLSALFVSAGGWLLPAPGDQLFALTASGAGSLYNRSGLVYPNINLIGSPVTWIDDQHLFIVEAKPTAISDYQGYVYDASSNTSSASMPLVIAGIGTMDAVNEDHVYSVPDNAIYSVSSGAITWQGSFPAITSGRTVGGNDPPFSAVAGGYIVYLSGHEIIAEPY